MTRLALLAFALLLATACGAGQPVEPVVGTITYEVAPIKWWRLGLRELHQRDLH